MEKVSKILIIGIGREFGGVEQFIFNMCNMLKEKGYEFGFLVYQNVCETNKEKIHGLMSEVYYINRYSEKPFTFLKEIYYFYKLHPEYKIVHCHASHASSIMYTLPIWFNRDRRIIFHSHNSSGDKIALHKIMRLIVNGVVDQRIACSIKAADWMYGNRKDIIIIYNGIDSRKYKFNIQKRYELRNKYNIQDKLVIGHVGRFEKQKNHFFLLDIYENILKLVPNAYLILIGEGSLKENILEEIEKRHMQKEILTLPFQTEIEDYYSAMDIFLLPSLFEGYPIVGVETQVSGLKCFFSDSITKEIKFSYLVKFISATVNAETWAKQIVRDIKEQENKLDERNRIEFERKIDIKDTIMQIEMLYKKK